MTKVLFDTQINSLKYQFIQGMWSKQSSITKVLFDIPTNGRKHDAQYNEQKYGKESFH